MKRIKLFIFSLFALFIISGCENNNTKVLTCSGTVKGNNINVLQNIKYTFKDDKLTKADMNFVFKDITVEDLPSVWDSFKTQFTEQNNPAEETGFKRTVSANDKEYTFNVNIEVDYEKISKETMEKYEVKDYSTKTYDEIIEDTTYDNVMSCK